MTVTALTKKKIVKIFNKDAFFKRLTPEGLLGEIEIRDIIELLYFHTQGSNCLLL